MSIEVPFEIGREAVERPILRQGREALVKTDGLEALSKSGKIWPRSLAADPAYGIGTMATFWFLQRAVSLM